MQTMAENTEAFVWGAENDEPDHDELPKLRDITLADLTLADQVAVVDINRPDSDGPQTAGMDNDGPQLYLRTKAQTLMTTEHF